MPMLSVASPIPAYAAQSHIGRRPRNEDAVQIPSPGETSLSAADHFFALADGMGGHKGGDLASRLACKGLFGYYQRKMSEHTFQNPNSIRGHLVAGMLRTDRLIRLRGRAEAAMADMGTTLSCLVIAQNRSIIAHVGDSRIYRLRRGRMTCLTTDHTFVQEMIFEGEVDPQRAASHPLRNLLTRSLGTAETLEWVDTRIDSVIDEDRFLLSTDGLHTALSAKRLAAVLSQPWPPRRIVDRMVMDALNAGATDNISAIVICVNDFGAPVPFAGHDGFG